MIKKPIIRRIQFYFSNLQFFFNNILQKWRPVQFFSKGSFSWMNSNNTIWGGCPTWVSPFRSHMGWSTVNWILLEISLLSSTSSGSGLESTQQLPIVSCSDGKKNKVELICERLAQNLATNERSQNTPHFLF